MRWEFALQFDSEESYSTVLLSFREYTRYKFYVYWTVRHCGS